LQRRRSERFERANAHLYDTGGMRPTHVRGHENILKRLLVHSGGFNLGFIMRTLIGVGTPARSLQGRAAAVMAFVVSLVSVAEALWRHREIRPGDRQAS
jgi:transposase